MPTATLSRQALPTDVRASAAPAPRRSSRLVPLLAMASGVAVLALAATVFIGAGDKGRREAAPVEAAVAVPAPADPLAITVSARDVSVVSQVYEPGHDSGWHAHSGIHAVAVLSGELTVYDGECRAQTFGPGEPYVGGQEVHLVRNEGTSAVVMAVTYLSPSTGNAPTRHASAPSGCVPGSA